MKQVLISLPESTYKELCENGTDRINFDIKQLMRDSLVNKTSLCDSCVSLGCFYPLDITGTHCDWYVPDSKKENLKIEH
mgnify:CR=1 FL=1